MNTQNTPFSIYKRKLCKSAAPERFRNSRGTRAISVRPTEKFYYNSNKRKVTITLLYDNQLQDDESDSGLIDGILLHLLQEDHEPPLVFPKGV